MEMNNYINNRIKAIREIIKEKEKYKSKKVEIAILNDEISFLNEMKFYIKKGLLK